MASRTFEIRSFNKTSLDILSSDTLNCFDVISTSYRTAEPFPHVFIDNFLKPELAEFAALNLPYMDQMPTLFKEPMSCKDQLSEVDGKWPKFSELFKSLQSAEFRGCISAITGVPELLGDDMLAGGGLHQSPNSGFLDLHVDANFHPENKKFHRLVNMLIYLNPRWQEQWGGKLELWEDGGNKPVKLVQAIEPKFKRAVIFNATRTSWHGVSPIKRPVGVARRSLAHYYYTATRPDEELYKDSSVIWMNRSSTWKRVLYPVMNFGIAVLKPHAKTVRKLLGREKVFDAGNKRPGS